MSARSVGIAVVSIAAAACNPAAPSCAPPVAAISILGGNGNPPVAIQGFTALTFVGARSTGDGITYAWDFGDGASSTHPLAVHVNNDRGLQTARLTVTDRHGRSASASAPYFVGSVEDGTAGWWEARASSTSWIVLDVVKSGAALSGNYIERVQGSHSAMIRPFTGTLTGLTTITIHTIDGLVAMTGTMEWDGGPASDYDSLGLRLFVRGGMADGLTLRFQYDDPY